MKAPVERCKSCEARVIFAVSAATGKRQIIDASPVEPGVTKDRRGRPIPRGNVLLVDWGETDEHGNAMPTAVARSREQEELFEDNAPLRVDHHVTCPEAQRWRKP